jgi:hypothetical protein
MAGTRFMIFPAISALLVGSGMIVQRGIAYLKHQIPDL